MDTSKRQDKVLVDNAIRAKYVLVIDGENDQNLGVMPLFEALKQASERGLNLVQMTQGGPQPTCKIIDYGKFRYDESKRLKAQLKKQRMTQVQDKELVFCPDTALNDLKTKARKAIEFLDDGVRLKVTIKCTGREIQHAEVFEEKLFQFLDLIPNAVATPISNEMRGRFSFLVSRQKSE